MYKMLVLTLHAPTCKRCRRTQGARATSYGGGTPPSLVVLTRLGEPLLVMRCVYMWVACGSPFFFFLLLSLFSPLSFFPHKFSLKLQGVLLFFISNLILIILIDICFVLDFLVDFSLVSSLIVRFTGD